MGFLPGLPAGAGADAGVEGLSCGIFYDDF